MAVLTSSDCRLALTVTGATAFTTYATKAYGVGSHSGRAQTDPVTKGVRLRAFSPLSKVLQRVLLSPAGSRLTKSTFCCDPRLKKNALALCSFAARDGVSLRSTRVGSSPGLSMRTAWIASAPQT